MEKLKGLGRRSRGFCAGSVQLGEPGDLTIEHVDTEARGWLRVPVSEEYPQGASIGVTVVRCIICGAIAEVHR